MVFIIDFQPIKFKNRPNLTQKKVQHLGIGVLLVICICNFLHFKKDSLLEYFNVRESSG